MDESGDDGDTGEKSKRKKANNEKHHHKVKRKDQKRKKASTLYKTSAWGYILTYISYLVVPTGKKGEKGQYNDEEATVVYRAAKVALNLCCGAGILSAPFP